MPKRKQAKATQRARSLKPRADRLARLLDAPPAFAPPPPNKFARLLDMLSSGQRKEYPLSTGLGDYFPDALVEASHVSFVGNEKHNPGEPLHWARGKSMDHADCAARHLAQRGGIEDIVIGDKTYRVRHSAQLVWRALAILQHELEEEFGFELPRGATIA